MRQKIVRRAKKMARALRENGTLWLCIRIFIFLAFLALFTAESLFQSGTFGYTPLFMLLSLTALSLGYVLLSAHYGEIVIKSFPHALNRGVSEELEFTVRNKGFLFLPRATVCLQLGGKTKMVDVTVPAHEGMNIEIDVCFEHIGIYPVEIKWVRYSDLIGLFRMRRKGSDGKVLVTPRLYAADGLGLESRGNASTSFLSENQHDREREDYDGVRDYIPGDSLKNIHWKLTAHLSKYVSRLYETPEREELILFLDLNPFAALDPDVRDCLIETALSAALYAIRKKFRVLMLCGRENRMERITINDLNGIREATLKLIEFGFSQTIAASELLESGQNLAAMRTVYVCSAEKSDALLHSMASLSAHGSNVLFLFAASDAEELELTEDEGKILSDNGVDWRLLTSAEQLGKFNGGSQSAERAAL